LRINGERSYRQFRIGEIAIDLLPDGIKLFSFDQALNEAREWWKSQEKIALPARLPREGHFQLPILSPDTPTDSVEVVFREYLEWSNLNKRIPQRIFYTGRAFILPRLGGYRIRELTTPVLSRWFDELIMEPPRVRSSYDAPVSHQAYKPDAESLRKRQNTANTTLRILTGMLTWSYRRGYVDSDIAWKRIVPHRNVSPTGQPYLTHEQSKALIAHSDADIANLIRGALLTGCRIGELRDLEVSDYLQGVGHIQIRFAKGRKARHVALSNEGKVFFDSMTVQRGGSEKVFLRQSGQKWTTSSHTRRLHNACNGASIEPPINFHILRHTYASRAAMAGIPLPVLAKQLGHYDTRIVERYYAKFSRNFINDIIEEKLPPMID